LAAEKCRSVVDAAACLTNRVYRAWAEGKIAGALLMDVKGAFDHVLKTQLTKRLQELKADPQIIKWTENFMTDRKACLLINGHESTMKPTKTGIPRGSPVSPILFAIYISGIFKEIEEEVMDATGLSFVDDISWLATGKDVMEITKHLEACGKAAKTWAARNAVEFDMIKTDSVLFTKKEKRADMAIDLGDGIRVQYNKGATRWLGFWLDSALNFKEHHNKRMSKAYQTENQIKQLHNKFGMTTENVRKRMIVTVQASALFGSEIWWRGQKNGEEDIQKMLNRTARAITGCMKSTPIAPLIAEAGVLPAETILNDRQRKYTNRLLALPEGHQAKNVLPATLINGPQETSNPEFTPTRRRTNGADLGTRLAKSVQIAIGENNEGETITDTLISVKGNITIKDRDTAANDGK
jgi:hypothetical protein